MKLLFFLLFSITVSTVGWSQLSWSEVNIPMSDGQSLKADIYLPSGWTSGPTILIQTPYNKNLYHWGLPLGIGLNQNSLNYAMVIVDWRGFWGSVSAAYVGAPTMGEDGYDVVEWIATQSWSNGKIGSWGPSALGKVQFATAREHPPHLTCIVPLVSISATLYQEYFPGGACRTEYIDQLSSLGFGLEPFVMANPYYNWLWSVTENATSYAAEIEVPALLIGGWYDHNITAQLELFDQLQSLSPENVRQQHRMLIGPWVHGGHGLANPGSAQQGELSYPEAAGVETTMAWNFFDYYLRDIQTGIDTQPAIQFFQMGSNTWQYAPSWPTSTSNSNLYLHSNQSLDSSVPNQSNQQLTFQYYPEDPSPTVGGPTLRADLNQGPYDQSVLVENRDDILEFTTEALDDDLKIQGSIIVHLRVSSDVLDTDFCVRLCDVYPDGRSMLVNDGVMRMRFREGFTSSNESFLTVGMVYDCIIELPPVALTFLAGHRIRLDISSSNYPRFNRNMNTGSAMYPNNNNDTLVSPVIANNTIHTSAENSSYIQLPVVSDNPTAMDATLSKESIGILFPNPADQIVYFRTSQEKVGLLKLIDQYGRVIEEIQSTGSTTTINLKGYASGVYLVQFICNNQITYTRFIIK